MAKEIKMKAVRLNDLITVIGIEPKEVAKIFPEGAVDAIDSLVKTRSELKKANEAFEAVAEKYQDKVKITLEGIQKEMDEIRKGEETPERKKLEKELVKKANEMIEAIALETGYKEAQEVEVTVMVGSNDRFDMLKKAFDKVACERYTNAEALSETSLALKSPVEVV